MAEQLSQREAVFLAVREALKGNIKEGAAVELTPEQRKQVTDALVKDFQAKKVVLKDTPANQEKLKSAELMKTYVSGLINNWLRRDPRLNGKCKTLASPTSEAKPAADVKPSTAPEQKEQEQKKSGVFGIGKKK